MAVVTGFTRHPRNPASLYPTQVICHWSVGNGLLQLATYGSDDREMPGKTSQTLQFTRESAAQLFRIMKEEFKFS
jgi:hypothetical protein